MESLLLDNRLATRELTFGGATMEFRLLGSVQIWAGGQPFDPGQPRQRSILAVLLADAGHLVTWEALISRVWGETPPDRARHSVYSHVARIRHVLNQAALVADGKPAQLRRQSGGYVIDVDPDTVDLHRFRRLIDRARAPDCPLAERVVFLREALSLWRGEPMAELNGDWVTRIRAVYTQQRLDAVLAWAQAEQEAGNAVAVVASLTRLAGEYPLVEPLTVALMRALCACGRTVHALDCYRSARRRLVDELGTEPGPELQQLHQAILRGDVQQPVPPVSGRVRGREPPAQLPADTPMFSGRSGELAHLDSVLEAARQKPTAAVVCAVFGTAGVGKTTFALHWAHRVAHRFPDGQLYANLRGFDPGGPALTPSEVLRGFLEALAVPRQQIPADLDAQAGLYRSLLAGRRVLVVLDNVGDAGQVRSLLPGGAGNVVVVTSRRRLTSLVTTEGAHPLTLDLMSGGEARELLAKRLTTARVEAEAEAVEEILTRCARLPLALAIVAARAATYPAFTLRALAEELRLSVDVLDALADQDAMTNVRAVFSWSYRILTPAAARLFRLLSLHPGPAVGVAGAASLSGIDVAAVQPLLTELVGAHLIAEVKPGRYTVHDLLRMYAAELAQSDDTETERHTAVRRILDRYLHITYAADRLLYARRDGIALPPPLPGEEPEDLADSAEAQDWFTTEHAVLLGSVELAAHKGFDRHAWQLAWALTTYLDRCGYWHDWAQTQQTGLAAAVRIGDLTGQAHCHRGLAAASAWLGRHDRAQEHCEHALAIFARLEDRAGEANVHLDLCWIFELQGAILKTHDHAERALDLYRQCGHLAGQARALNTLGWALAHLEDPRKALRYCQQALALHTTIGDRSGEAYTWDSLGYINHRLDNNGQAATCYRNAVDLFRSLGERFYEADTLDRLGDVHLAAGERDEAYRSWRQALKILQQLEHPDAAKIRTKLEPAL